MSSSPAYLDPVVVAVITESTVLDVGCGYGRWCHRVQSNFWEAGLATPPLVDGFDAFQANVDYCERQNDYRRVWQQSMASTLNNRWDTVLACEVIEHVAQEKVESVVTILENAVNQRIIFTTPNWPYFRSGADTMVGYNRHKAHLSYVPGSFLRRRGYTLLGAGFGNSDNLPSRAVGKLFSRWASTLDSLLRFLTSFVQSLMAYKDLN